MTIEPEKRAEELRALIKAHNIAYYDNDSPTISDAEWDMLMRELVGLEDQYPHLRTTDSPTQNIGGSPSKIFSPVTHRVPMMSLDNAFEVEALHQWKTKLERKLSPSMNIGDLVCELKFDGLAISVRYEQGRLVQAATRGMGSSEKMSHITF